MYERTFVGGGAYPNKRRAVAKAKHIMFENLEGAVRRGQGGENKWTDYVQSDVRAFGIAGD